MSSPIAVLHGPFECSSIGCAFPPQVPEWERIAQEMRMAAERVVQGTATVDQAVVALDRKADEILEKRRWMMDKAAT